MTFPARVSFVLTLLAAAAAFAATSVSQYGITWTFAEDRPVGQFVTGDWWVVGPVTVVGISTDLHDPAFTPSPGDDGAMLNPGGTSQQGYDSSLNSYRAELNAAEPNGQRVSPSNPLTLQPHSSLVSMVSWLYNSATDAEPGCPSFNGGTHAPRPVTRSGAILTVLPAAAPDGSFRPAYCGDDKTVKFNLSDLDLSQLNTLAPVSAVPDPATLFARIRRPWIDHVYEYLGAMIHPSENMPNYGRDLADILADTALLLNLDFSQLPGSPGKLDLVIPYVQFGIDCTGVADVGGGWPENGGHGPGRKLPIVAAGALLNDAHMLSVGQWSTYFQDDMQTFYVSQAEVDITHSDAWNPDSRASEIEPYELSDIGMPEWGIRHTRRPTADNRGWSATYRDINGTVIPGTALAAALMGRRATWDHEAYFDYAARYMEVTNGGGTGTNSPSAFAKAMWAAYAQDYLITPVIPGDADGDGHVNVNDFIILKQHYNTTSGATRAQGDFNGDGAVDIADFILLKQNYNK